MNISLHLDPRRIANGLVKTLRSDHDYHFIFQLSGVRLYKNHTHFRKTTCEHGFFNEDLV